MLLDNSRITVNWFTTFDDNQVTKVILVSILQYVETQRIQSRHEVTCSICQIPHWTLPGMLTVDVTIT